MNHPEIIFVLARADNGVIGKDGDMPWHLPADLRHFKQITGDRPMIMGRKTFESLPVALPGRRHIVLTRDTEWADEDAEAVGSIEAALAAANAPHVTVIGGAEIFALFRGRADRIELTEIHAAPDGDTFVPAFGLGEWTEIAREPHPAEGDRPAFDFVTLVRK